MSNNINIMANKSFQRMQKKCTAELYVMRIKMPKKTIEEHLLEMVADWREDGEGCCNVMPDRGKARARDDSMQICADRLEEFVHCNPGLKDLEI